MIAKGYTVGEIAEELYLSVKTSALIEEDYWISCHL